MIGKSINLYKLISEKKYTKFLNDHPKKPIFVLVSSNNCPECQDIKPLFFKLSLDTKYDNCMFGYVNLEKFDNPDDKYSVSATPTIICYINNISLFVITGSNKNIILDKINQVVNDISKKSIKSNKSSSSVYSTSSLSSSNDSNETHNTNDNNKNVNDENNDQQLLNMKYNMLLKLNEFSRLGIPLTKHFSMNDTLDDIKKELTMHSTYIQYYTTNPNSPFNQQQNISKPIPQNNQQQNPHNIPQNIPPNNTQQTNTQKTNTQNENNIKIDDHQNVQNIENMETSIEDEREKELLLKKLQQQNEERVKQDMIRNQEIANLEMLKKRKQDDEKNEFQRKFYEN